jgi:hypothetical protein
MMAVIVLNCMEKLLEVRALHSHVMYTYLLQTSVFLLK